MDVRQIDGEFTDPCNASKQLISQQWMHNGEISEFKKIKRALQQSLPEELFLYPSGYTGKPFILMFTALIASELIKRF